MGLGDHHHRHMYSNILPHNRISSYRRLGGRYRQDVCSKFCPSPHQLGRKLLLAPTLALERVLWSAWESEPWLVALLVDESEFLLVRMLVALTARASERTLCSRTGVATYPVDNHQHSGTVAPCNRSTIHLRCCPTCSRYHNLGLTRCNCDLRGI
jgi:hypothetical protein